MNQPIKKSGPGKQLRHEDYVALERTDRQHWLLEKAIVDLLVANNMRPLTNRDIDLLVRSEDISVVFEVKSCSVDETGKRVREAIYQSLEYRFLYRESLAADTRLCVVSEHRPTGSVDWLVEYMEDLGIGIVWKKDDGKLACTEFTKTLLADILSPVTEVNS